ncbi:MAG: RHS repeat-associated core domain-containing protein [Niabella sp.]
MPKAITGTATVNYVYDAAGTKLKKVTGTETRWYIDGIEYYTNSTTTTPAIDLLHTATGVARKSGTAYNCEYFLADHLGNTRILHDKAGTVLQQTDYYPFGLPIETYTAVPNNYLYQGKELQRELGLGMYDFHARQLDPTIGRFTSIDPHADRYPSVSPYASMNNSPINYVDPNGKDYRIGYHQDEDGNITITISSTIYVRGYDQANKVKEYNQFLKDNTNLLSNTTKNKDGTSTTINLEFSYVEATNEDVARLTDPETRNGDNLMTIQENEARSAATPITKKTVDPVTGEITKEKVTDFKAVLGGKSDRYGSAGAAFHENMHLFGLRDWYNNAADKKAVGDNDIMAIRLSILSFFSKMQAIF